MLIARRFEISPSKFMAPLVANKSEAATRMADLIAVSEAYAYQPALAKVFSSFAANADLKPLLPGLLSAYLNFARNSKLLIAQFDQSLLLKLADRTQKTTPGKAAALILGQFFDGITEQELLTYTIPVEAFDAAFIKKYPLKAEITAAALQKIYSESRDEHEFALKFTSTFLAKADPNATAELKSIYIATFLKEFTLKSEIINSKLQQIYQNSRNAADFADNITSAFVLQQTRGNTDALKAIFNRGLSEDECIKAVKEKFQLTQMPAAREALKVTKQVLAVKKDTFDIADMVMMLERPSDNLAVNLRALIVAVFNDVPSDIDKIMHAFHDNICEHFCRDLMQGFEVEQADGSITKVKFKGNDENGSRAIELSPEMKVKILKFIIPFLKTQFNLTDENIYYLISGWTQNGYRTFLNSIGNDAFTTKYVGNEHYSPRISTDNAVPLRLTFDSDMQLSAISAGQIYEVEDTDMTGALTGKGMRQTEAQKAASKPVACLSVRYTVPPVTKRKDSETLYSTNSSPLLNGPTDYRLMPGDGKESAEDSSRATIQGMQRRLGEGYFPPCIYQSQNENVRVTYQAFTPEGEIPIPQDLGADNVLLGGRSRWQRFKDFCSEHRTAIVIGVLTGIICGVIAAATWGTAAPFLATVGAWWIYTGLAAIGAALGFGVTAAGAAVKDSVTPPQSDVRPVPKKDEHLLEIGEAQLLGYEQATLKEMYALLESQASISVAPAMNSTQSKPMEFDTIRVKVKATSTHNLATIYKGLKENGDLTKEKFLEIVHDADANRGNELRVALGLKTVVAPQLSAHAAQPQMAKLGVFSVAHLSKMHEIFSRSVDEKSAVQTAAPVTEDAVKVLLTKILANGGAERLKRIYEQEFGASGERDGLRNSEFRTFVHKHADVAMAGAFDKLVGPVPDDGLHALDALSPNAPLTPPHTPPLPEQRNRTGSGGHGHTATAGTTTSGVVIAEPGRPSVSLNLPPAATSRGPHSAVIPTSFPKPSSGTGREGQPKTDPSLVIPGVGTGVNVKPVNGTAAPEPLRSNMTMSH